MDGDRKGAHPRRQHPMTRIPACPPLYQAAMFLSLLAYAPVYVALVVARRVRR